MPPLTYSTLEFETHHLLPFIELVATGDSATPQLETLITRLLAEDVAQHVTKPAILHLSKTIKALTGDALESIASFAISTLRQHTICFDDADYFLRDALFDHYCSMEQFKEAAQSLAGVNFDSAAMTFSNAEKAALLVKIAEAFLEDDETVDAEVFINRASPFMNAVESDVGLQLRYRSSCARILDANRKFVEASMKYYELSNTASVDVVHEDLLELLGKAVTCAVLGKAGPQRSRVLGLLFKDERIRSLDQLPKYSSHAAVLTKTYTEQLLRRDELATFEASLSVHHKALTGEGFTVLEKAVIEHNMLATGKIYDNISFEELGNILHLDTNKAERVAAKMITEGRLKAIIDQTEGILFFNSDSDPLLRWDEKIKDICTELTNGLDKVITEYPNLVR